MELNDHIEKVLFTEQQISQRVSEIASLITRDFKAGGVTPVIVGVATGAFLFVADLVRKIHLPITVDFVRAESYGSGTVSNGQPTISLGLKVDVRGKHVILVRVVKTLIPFKDFGLWLNCLLLVSCDFLLSKECYSLICVIPSLYILFE